MSLFDEIKESIVESMRVGDTDQARELINRIGLHGYSNNESDDYTPIMMLLSRGLSDIAELIIDYSDVQFISKDGMTATILSLSNTRFIRVSEDLHKKLFERASINELIKISMNLKLYLFVPDSLEGLIDQRIASYREQKELEDLLKPVDGASKSKIF